MNTSSINCPVLGNVDRRKKKKGITKGPRGAHCLSGETRSVPWCCGGVRGMREESREAVDTCWTARRQLWRSDRLKGWVGSSTEQGGRRRTFGRERKSQRASQMKETLPSRLWLVPGRRSGSCESYGRVRPSQALCGLRERKLQKDFRSWQDSTSFLRYLWQQSRQWIWAGWGERQRCRQRLW